MEYRSALHNHMSQEPSNHSSTLGGGRYTPYYTPRRYTSFPQGPHSSQNSSTQYKYTRCKPQEYPEELTAMFGAAECKLCAVELLTPIVAKMHYSGKPHFKKIKSYLNKCGIKIGLPTYNAVSNSVSESIFSEYCDVCGVQTKTASEQLLHFSGKNHKKNMLDPANAKKRKKAYETIDLSGIGINLSSNISETVDENKIKVDDLKNPFTCTLCDVTANTQGQLDQHLSGKKHKEKLEKKNSIADKKIYPWMCTTCDVSFKSKYEFNLHINGNRHAKSSAKTKVNGKNYCKECDLSFTFLDQYKKHEKICLLKALDPYVRNVDCDKSLTNIDFENLEEKWVCTNCHMVFENETEYNEHKRSDRHIFCVLNNEDGDPMTIEHLYCILCKKQYHGFKEYADHLFNEKHMRLSQDKADVISNPELFHCNVCNLTMTGQLKDQHLRDRNHIRKTWKEDVKRILTDLATTETTSESYLCVDCHVGPLNFVQYSQHLTGEDHINVMINAKLSNIKYSYKHC